MLTNKYYYKITSRTSDVNIKEQSVRRNLFKFISTQSVLGDEMKIEVVEMRMYGVKKNHEE